MLRLMIVSFFLFLSISSHANVSLEFLETLYKPSSVRSLKLNPSGDYALVIYFEDDIDYIDIYNLNTREGKNIQVAGDKRVSFENIEWLDNDSALIQYADFSNTILDVYHFDFPSSIELKEKISLPRLSGDVINVLPDQDDKFIFAKKGVDGSYQSFYKVDVGSISIASDIEEYLSLASQLDVPYENVTDYAFDAKNSLRFIEVETEEGFAYHYKSSLESEWEEVARTDKKNLKYFFSLDRNERLLTLVTKDDNKNVIAYIDPKTLNTISIAYEHPISDVQTPIYDRNKDLIGGVVTNQGKLEYVYLDETLKKIKEDLKRRKNLQDLYITSSNLDNSKFVILGARNGFYYKYYDYDLSKDKLRLLVETRPWLKGIEFATTHTLQVRGTGGHLIEAYLTIPNDISGKIPLLVNPHGGPIDVRDYKYSRKAEVFARLGYASLRVNFRGSSGYGKKFIESAKNGFGTIIEEDIHAVLLSALDTFGTKLDKQKICSIGTSYGGYSTTMLLAKYPNLFKCGVSFAGVFDLNLQVNEAKRFSAYKDWIDQYFKEYVANVEDDLAVQKAKSPVYHAQNIVAPLLLLHGTEDSVVDLEQSYRMKHAMEKYEKSVELKILDGFPHGFENADQQYEYYKIVDEFLSRYLN